MTDYSVVIGRAYDCTDHEQSVTVHVREHENAGKDFAVHTDKYEVYISDENNFDIRFLDKSISVSDALTALRELGPIVQNVCLSQESDNVYLDMVESQTDFIAAVGGLYELKG